MEIEILYEDPHLIVCVKPPKVPSQGDPTGDADMLTLLKEHLKKEYPKVKNPYLGLVHRLDRPVGGVMVFAKTKEANGFLSKQMQDKSFQKKYLVVACGKPEQTQGELKDFLLKLSSVNMSKVVETGTKNSKEAILEYEVLKTIKDEQYGQLSLMKINLKTGRHHQIRVQLAYSGLGIWGDNKYNKAFVKNKEWTQIALWSTELSFIHPKTKKRLVYTSIPEEVLPFSLFTNIL
ncbi:RNA pseudouridine synthase [Alkalicella caledoniensis]|uniref:RNA pseudouridylate synthase n=1 Tax=Alkalicella caledoniensis TaxID=2731377 RepID=A0A7G9W7L9_ALKCA|nr:RNA pseudouridine synthase [Alkalicella caledoniensis]QNO14681.1 RNA pseudouridine synthase [Alkalicella caledoniensis]